MNIIKLIFELLFKMVAKKCDTFELFSVDFEKVKSYCNTLINIISFCKHSANLQ